MSDIAALVANNLDIWTGAIERKRGAGRGGGSKRISLYGIERLRALILNLAVRGKLMPQDSAEESAEKLLGKIRKERAAAKLVGKSLKAGNGIDRSLFSGAKTPQGWVTVPLSDIILGNVGGGTPSKAEPSYWGGDIPWASVKDIGKSKFVSDTQDRITELGLAKSSANLVPAGNIILVTRMGLGQLSINTIDLAINQDLRAIFLSKYVDIDYCYNYFLTCEIEGAGMTVKGIKLDHLLGLPFPLPPLAEQRRIVAKVDELMALCDELERESADALVAHQTLVETLLAILANSADAADLAANWARLESYFDTLFTTEASIDALKQTILDLAVRGKLVAQDAADDEATLLIQDWKMAKGKALKSGGDRRIKSSADPKDPPFPLPSHWAFQSFENIFLFIDYRGNTPPKTSDGVPLITAKNVRMGYIDREPREFISEATFSRWMTRGLPKIGDLFFTTEAPLGNICQNDMEAPFAIAQRLICFRPYGHVNTRFFMLAIMSRSMQQLLDDHATGMTARGIKAAKLKPLPLPVPPQAEQHRIVTKVYELMALCEALKGRLADAAETRRHLADAIVERAAA